MKTFNDIITWLIAHKDSIIIGIVIELTIIGFVKTWSLTKKIPKAVKMLMKIKGIKYLEFILLYALPLGTIVWMIIDKTNAPTFKNIALFIIICISFIYNILMIHIINLYKMNKRLSKTSLNELTKINKTFGKIYKHIEKTKTENNLK